VLGKFCGSSGKIINEADPKRAILSTFRKFLRQGSVMSLSPQVQKLCQQAEQEKDFRKLLLLVSQINHVLKSQPPPSKEILRSSIPDKQTR